LEIQQFPPTIRTWNNGRKLQFQDPVIGDKTLAVNAAPSKGGEL
jgi:hypothetical protein